MKSLYIVRKIRNAYYELRAFGYRIDLIAAQIREGK